MDNHEEMLFESPTDGFSPEYFFGVGGGATFKSYGPGRDLSLISEEHFECLEGCLDFHEPDSNIFVHANYFPDIPMA